MSGWQKADQTLPAFGLMFLSALGFKKPLIVQKVGFPTYLLIKYRISDSSLKQWLSPLILKLIFIGV